MRLLPAVLSIALLSAGSAFAQATINSFTVTYTAPGYLIKVDATDGNATTNRHYIATTTEINFTTAANYRVDWSLLDPADVVVGTGSNALGAVAVGLRTVNGQIVPSGTLAQGVLYRAKMNVVNTTSNTVVATQTRPTGHKYLHFTGTTAMNAERNILAVVDSVTVDRDWLLETDATKQTLPVTVNYTLHRYDAWTSVPTSVSVNVRFSNNTVVQSPGPGPIAGTWTNTTTTLGVSTNTGGATPAPATASGSLTMQFDPTAVLDNYSSLITVGIEHLEDPTTSEWKPGQADSVSSLFVHMTGQINFGSIVTNVTSLTSNVPGPPAVFIPGGSLRRDVVVAAGAGSLPGYPNHTYSGALSVVVDDGIASCMSGSSATLNPANPLVRINALNGVTFNRSGTITLDFTGAHLSAIQARLPVGVGWAADRTSNILESYVTFGPVDLGSNLAPSATTVVLTSAVGTFFLCEETKPLYIGCPEFRWHTDLGEFQAGPTALQAAFSIRQPLLDWLEAQPVSADMKLKKSNDHLYNHVSASTNTKWKTGVSNGGEMSGTLVSGYNKLTTHFPYNTELVWNGGFLNVVGDLINPALSGFTGVDPAYLLYGQHCAEAILDGCGSEEYGDVTVTPANYKVTGDGGIQFPGPPTMASLKWGYIDANAASASTADDYAHSVTSAFPTANFLMAGTFLRGDQNALADEDGASVLLLSGFDPANLATAERPDGGAGYESGAADYAGVNFRCTPLGFQGQSTLQDSVVGPYSLTTRSKYYVRWSGVTGIHEAPAGGFPGSAVLGGYDFTFDSFGFSFLSTEMQDSRADGALAIDAPIDETFEFTELRFTCLGMLDTFKLDLPAGVDPKTFTYWDAPITPYSAQFVATNECDPGAGTTFVLGFKAHVAHLAEDVSGELGILNTGNFAVPADSSTTVADSVPTRLVLPSVMTFDGPTGETYTFMPAQLGYLNNPDKGSDASGVGYWNFFGTLDVPFFKDMQVNLHTRCRESSSAMLDLMGGWPTNGWTDSSGDPFTSALFDLQNAGFPWNVAGVTTESYRAGDTATTNYLPRAQQSWLGGLINFDYPCTWNSTTRDFAGVPLPALNLLVLNAEHQLTYLSADNANLTFGVQYGDLPSISVSNLAFTALDQATNFGASWVTTQGDKVFNGLNTAVGEFGTMLEDKAEAMVDEALQRVTDPWLDALINEIKALPTADAALFRTQAKAKIHAYLVTNTDSITKRIQKLVDGTESAQDLLADLNMRLERIKQGLKGVTSILSLDPSTISITDLDGTPLATAASGLLAKNGTSGEREALTLLAKALIDLLSTVAVDSSLEESLQNVLAELEPTLDTISATIEDIYDIVVEVQTQVNGAGELVNELRDILTSATATTALNTLANTLDPEVQAIFDAVDDVDLTQLTALADDWKEDIRQKIRDALYASDLIAQVQTAVKERLYDVQQAFNQAIDSAFAAVNQAIRDALTPVLAEVDAGIDDLLGDVADKIGAGSLNGYAHFNADSLDLLHIDGEFQINLDEPFVLHAYLEVKELDSDGGAGSICTAAGVDATEVTIGVKDFGLTFMSSEIRMDISTKFALGSSGAPIGMGGSFEMTEGKIGFETFSITEFGATAMFGLTENYLGAKVAMTFGSYSAAGGFFVGTTCDDDPLIMIDPLIGPLVSLPFSGVYAYGECEFPIYGTGTCLFNISGKAGAGVLYNSVVPEYGGRMTLGVTGEALCAVTLGGEVSLAGVKSGSVFNFAGTGRLFGEVGKCPFCLSFDKTVGFSYTDAGGWAVDY